MTNPLLNRPKSGFPVSIGTGLALETIFEPQEPVYDDSRIVPDRPPPQTYTEVLINLSTIARNLISSVPTKDLLFITKNQVLDVFLEEVNYLSTIFQMNETPVQFYVHSYAYPRHTYKDKMRVATTDIQTKQFSFTEYCLKHASAQDDTLSFSKNIKTSSSSTALILTHVPWDLLSYGNFKRLDLLESHTGTIKTRSEFNTKYMKLGNNDMSFLPFMEYLLSVFGDHVMFKPSTTKDRARVYEDMVKKGVHPLMTEMQLMF